MPLTSDDVSSIHKIDNWFQTRCNGEWKHRFGVKIESTDNPGWLLTFKEINVMQDGLASVIGDLLRNYGAQVATDGTMVRVFAASLNACLTAAAVVIDVCERRGGTVEPTQ